MNNIKIPLLGALVFVAFLLVPLFSSDSNSVPLSSIRYGAATFYGMAITDLRQDIIGFHAMIKGESLYPKLEGDQSSTHLPTTFLFVAPVAFFTWRDATMLWAYLMLFALIYALKLSSFDWRQSIGYGLLSILWMPVMMSFGQFTIVWLLLTAVAYRLHNKSPFWSGFHIGLASLIKLLPAVMMVPMVMHKKWNSIYGFLAAWGIGVLVVLTISYQAFFQYLGTKNNIHAITLRSDNANLLVVGYRYLGIPGFAIALALVGIFVFVNRKILYTSFSGINEQAWMVWTYLSVVFMPVVWVYSLAPLLPTLLNLLRSKKIAVKVIAWLVVFIPIFVYPWGEVSMPFVVAMTVLLGMGLILYNTAIPLGESKY